MAGEVSAPQRILMTADPIGGVWIYALELAAALQPRGVRIALATMGAALSRDQRAQALACGNVELFESAYKMEWMDEPWAEVDRAGKWLLNLQQKVQPDLIHLNGYAHAVLPWNAPVVVVAHSCVLSWWRAVKGEPAPSRWNTYRERVKAGLHAADAIIAPSRAMAAEIEYLYGPLPVEVIPNGRTAMRFFPRKKEPFILSSGRLWDDAKNISALADVAPRVRWPIYAAGSLPGKGQLSKTFQSLHCIGKLSSDQLAHWFGRASIYALPARYEPFGLSVLEAALCGCALVLGDIASLREHWSDAAIFVDPGNPWQIAEQIESLIADPGALREWATRAQVRAREFTPAAMVELYCRACAKIMDGQSRRNQNKEGVCAF